MKGSEETAVVAAATAGDASAFTRLAERHRRELHVHCYRMLGSLDDADDLVQETLLRAWRNRATFERRGDGSFRAWLYRIATNACLDALADQPRRVLPHELEPPSDPEEPIRPPADLPWLQPYPDSLLDAVVARETIELVFLTAIQLLPPRQRAALILRDVLDWSAQDTAAALQTSVPAANSALQRARAVLRERLPARRAGWEATAPSDEQRALLRRYLEAHERFDPAALLALLREDARGTMPPYPTWYQGRDAIVAAVSRAHHPASPDYIGAIRFVPVGANRQPAAAAYLLAPGESEHRALALDVLRIEDGRIAEIVAFGPAVFPAFGLEPTMSFPPRRSST